MEDSLDRGRTLKKETGGAVGRIDRYELVKELGGGGFGCVYLARDTVAGIDVAVKGLPPIVRLNKEELENIRKNFALVSRLHHPNIAAALHLHQVEKAVYQNKGDAEKLRVFEGDTLVVMQYAPGVTLSRWRRQFPGGRVPFEKALAITRQIADALDYAHKEKVLHRDIKPANIMIETDMDGDVTARVLDFGLAAEIRSSMGRVSQKITDTSGTRPYMAPEQWLGRAQGRETDQYSLAVLFYELVSGAVPFASVFETGDPVMMMTTVGHERPELLPDLPKKTRAALLKALSKTREERFASCRAFVSAIGGAVSPRRGRTRSLAYCAAVVLALLALVGTGVVCGRKVPARGQAAPAGPVRTTTDGGAPVSLTVREAAASAGKEAADHAESRPAARRVNVAVSAEDEVRRQDRAAEVVAFQMSEKAKNAYDLMMRESAEVKTLFCGELKAFETDRAAGDAARARAQNVAATNCYARALATATELKKRVDDCRVCKAFLDRVVEAKKRVDAVEAEKTLPTRYHEILQLIALSAGDYEKKNFASVKIRLAEAEKKLVTLRGDVVNAVLDLARGHWKANRLDVSLKEAEKVLGWDPSNAEAQAVKREVQKEIEKRDIALAISAFEAKPPRWKEGFGHAQKTDLLDRRIQYYFGVMYESGFGVSENDTEAAKWYRKSAEQGYARAQCSLGLMYETGCGVPKDEAEAVKWYRKAADQGDGEAQCCLAYMYDVGHGTSKDKLEAMKWYRKAAEQGHARAQSNLGVAYEYGNGIAKDELEAVKWYRKAAEQGYARAQCNLGLMYEMGQGVPKDEAEAVRWYRLSAEQGHARAQCCLAVMYEAGRGTVKDEGEAVTWYRKAADQGYARALCNLGLMYEEGRGVSKDAAEALNYYRKAAEKGYARAKTALARLEAAAKKAPSEEATRRFLEACKNEKYADAVKLMNEIDGENKDVQFCLGVLYHFGYGVAVDDTVAVKWYRKAADQGHCAAQYNLAVSYDNGQGVPKDAVEAVKWYHKAADQGHCLAQYNLAVSYDKGQGVPEDVAEAVNYYRKAAEQGYAPAQNNLGVLYRNGRGVEKDLPQAFRWYQKAALQGDASAQLNLAGLYEDGLGVSKDLAAALEWYRKSARQGNEKAREGVRRLEALQLPGEKPEMIDRPSNMKFCRHCRYSLEKMDKIPHMCPGCKSNLFSN